MNRVDNKRELDKRLRENDRILALFCASWCPFCQSFFPVFEERVVSGDFGVVLRVYLDDYDNQLWTDYSIESVPTVILFEQGTVSRRLDGEMGEGLSQKQLREWVEQL
jgi:thioredoxin-like negative regulator of GroEL